MKKRIGSLLLSLCMALSMLAVPARAFETPAATDYWVNLTQEQAVQMLTRIAAKTETRNVVLLCYPADGAAPVPTAIQQFSDYANSSRIKLYSYAFSTGDSASRVDSELAPLLGGAAPTRWPVAVTYNTSTQVCAAREYVTTLVAPVGESDIVGLRDLMLMNSVSSGSSGADPEPGPAPELPPPSRPNSIDEKAWEVLRLTNQHRMSIGLQPLSTFAELQAAANLRAEEIYRSYRPNHTRPDGRICWTAYAECNVNFEFSAENIASGQPTAAIVMDSWLTSPGHRHNIESANPLHMGVGYYYKNTGYSAGPYNWTQDFAASRACQFSNLRLSVSTLPGSPGADLDTLVANVTVAADCYRHGTCYLPLISAMCSGYSKTATGDQTITVTYGGQTAQLTISAAHTWDSGTTTKSATCTEPGEVTYSCTDADCGATRTESIPALGHSFSGEGLTCTKCGTTLTDVVSALINGGETVEISTGWTTELAEQKATEIVTQALEKTGMSSQYACRITTVSFSAPVNGTRENPYGTYGIYEYALTITPAKTETPEGTETPDNPDVPDDTKDSGDGKTPETPVREETEIGTIDVPLAQAVPLANASEAETLRLYLPATPYDPSSEPPVVSIPTYAVSAAPTQGGRITVRTQYAARGSTVTLTAVADDGCALVRLTVLDSQGVPLALKQQGEGIYSFVMPAGPVTIQAVFQPVLGGKAPWSSGFPDTWYCIAG